MESCADRLKWLSADDESQLASWTEAWLASEARRPHDHPTFLRVMGKPDDTPVAVLYQHPGGGRIIYAFYWRHLNRLPCFREIERPLRDIVSTYGYGGPVFEGPETARHEAATAFECLFTEEVRRRDGIAEFVREDLFQGRLALRNSGEHVCNQMNIIVNLRKSIEEIERAYKPKVRKNVNRALSNGLKIIIDCEGKFIDDFLRIYYHTMERREASCSFFISKDNFMALLKDLKPTNSVFFVHVKDSDGIIASEMILTSSDSMYSFLGGTLKNYFEMRPNDLLKHEAIMWGRKKGYSHFVLGGGASPDDGIFKYKEGFEPDGKVPFFVRRIIHNPGAYEFLLAKRKEYEMKNGATWEPRAGFFPLYLG